jgi:hypothetical protein
MRNALQFSLALLDEGLIIYRRNFGAFVLLAAIWFVPIAILVGLCIVALSWLSENQQIVLGLFGLLLLFPLLIYLLAVLSRAAADAINGQAINIRHALAVNPIRVISMSVFGVIYALVAQIVSGILTFICICPVFLLGSISVFGVAASSSSNPLGSAVALLIGSVGYIGSNLFIVMVGGATANSVIYALQPWAIEQLRFGVTIEQSLNLTMYRFGTNILVCALAALIASAGGLSVAVFIGLAIPLPTIWLLGEESRVAQAIAATAWLLGLTLVVPPLPIWMTLLYQRNVARREGVALAQKIEEWNNAD